MTWYVKASNPDGSTLSIICELSGEVLDHLDDQRSRGRTVWVEDTSGNRVDETAFSPPPTRDGLAEKLTSLPQGEIFRLDPGLYGDLFPLGGSDGGAQTRAAVFARLVGCSIEDSPGSSEVVFIKVA